MLFAASESAVTKKPRLRRTMSRSSSVRPPGSFHSWMSRLMLISCGIQWLAQAARYFSQAHLYLKGTSWLTSALELMMSLSSTLTRRKAPLAGAGTGSAGAGAGASRPLADAGAVSSKVSIGFLVVPLGSHRLGEKQRLQARRLGLGERTEFGPVLARQLAQQRRALRLGGEGKLVRRDVQVPLGADDPQPLGVLGVLLEELGLRQIRRLLEVQGAKGQQPPARRHHREQPCALRRRPERRHERPGEAAAAQGDHWQASQSGLSIAQTFSRVSEGTAFNSPVLTVDFSAWVAPIERR